MKGITVRFSVAQSHYSYRPTNIKAPLPVLYIKILHIALVIMLPTLLLKNTFILPVFSFHVISVYTCTNNTESTEDTYTPCKTVR